MRDSPSWPKLAAGERRPAALPSDDRIERKIPVPVRFRLRLRRHIDPHALVSRLYRRAKVVAERIANSEAEALGSPVKTIDKAYAIKKGHPEIALDDLGPCEAYALTITLSR